jgi:hypothetical protein
MDNINYDKVEPQDFLVRVRPYLDDKGSWNGEIDVAVVTQPENNLSDDDYFQMMHFCKMLASTIPVMELNEDFRELVHNYVVEKIDKEYEVELEQKPEITYGDDNIVTIDFKTNTKGNA